VLYTKRHNNHKTNVYLRYIRARLVSNLLLSGFWVTLRDSSIRVSSYLLHGSSSYTDARVIISSLPAIKLQYSIIRARSKSVYHYYVDRLYYCVIHVFFFLYTHETLIYFVEFRIKSRRRVRINLLLLLLFFFKRRFFNADKFDSTIHSYHSYGTFVRRIDIFVLRINVRVARSSSTHLHRPCIFATKPP